MAKKGSQSKAGGIFVDIRMGIANLQKDTREASRSLRGLEKDIKNIGKNISTALNIAGSITGLYAVTKSIQQLGGALIDLANKGDAAGDITDSFKLLGGSSKSIEDAKNALLGTVNAFDLMSVANQALLKNIPDVNTNFAKMADFAKRYAEATKQNTLPVLQSFTDALAKGKSKGLKEFGFELSKTTTAAQNQAEVLKLLEVRINTLAAPTDSVAEAQEALSQSMQEMWTKMGIGVNQNEALTTSLRDLKSVIDNIDFKDVGSDLSTILSLFVQLATVALPPVISLLKDLSNIFKAATQNTLDGAAVAFLKSKEALDNQIKLLEQSGQLKDPRYGGRARESYDRLIKERDANQSNFEITTGLIKKQNEQKNKLDLDAAAKSNEALKKLAEQRLQSELKQTKDAADKKAKSAIDALNKEVGKFNEDELKNKLEKAIDIGNSADFSASLDGYKNKIYTSIIDAHKEAYAQGGEAAKAVEDLATKTAETQAAEYTEKFADAARKTAEEIAREHEEAYKLSISNWELLFDQAINGVSISLEDMLKQAAVGFAAELANATIGSLAGIDLSDPKSIGSSLAKSVLGQLTSTGGTTGIGPVADGAEYAGMLAGESMVSTLTAAMPAVGAALGTAAVVSFGKSVFDNQKQPYEQYGRDSTTNTLGRVQAAFSSGGLSELGLMGLSGGSNNAETNARKAFAGALEELIAKIGGLDINRGGKIERLTDIKVGGGDRFNDPNWADSFNQQSSAGVFSALGEGLKGILGITEDVGGQMAMILSENFGGSVDNARTAVQQLGLSFQDFEEYFLAMAERGEIRWHDFNVQIAGISEAFKPGLAAVGATKQAYDQLIAAGGKGINSVIQAKNLAQEGLDLGLENVSQLAELLKNQGANAEFAGAFAQSATDRGLGALKAIVDGSNQEIGSLVGGMEAASAALNQTWADMFKQLDELKGKFEAIPSEVITKFKVESEIDPDLIRLMDAGGLSGGSIPDLSMLSNSGTDAMRSSANRVARSAVKLPAASAGRAVTVNVDARGATPGVERQVIAAVRRMKGEIIGEAAEKIAGYSRRGQF